MKLATYRLPQGSESFGIISSDGIIDLKRRLQLPDLKSLLASGTHRAAEFAGEPVDHALADVELLPPIPNPDHIIGIGFNTRSHLKEAAEFFKTKLDEPKYPHVFLRSAASHVGHGARLVIPRVSKSLDYEGEIAVVIGKPGRCIARADALSHIAGIACYNDGSVRDFQMHSTQATPAKNFRASGAFGPWIVTLDEAGPVEQLVMETRINGELRQHLEISDLFFDFAQLIEYVSQPFELQPGDVIITGSPAGIGGIQGKFLQPGDEVEIHIPTVGSLRNTVAALAA